MVSGYNPSQYISVFPSKIFSKPTSDRLGRRCAACVRREPRSYDVCIKRGETGLFSLCFQAPLLLQPPDLRMRAGSEPARAATLTAEPGLRGLRGAPPDPCPPPPGDNTFPGAPSGGLGPEDARPPAPNFIPGLLRGPPRSLPPARRRLPPPASCPLPPARGRQGGPGRSSPP